jgi:hypothetical protein
MRNLVLKVNAPERKDRSDDSPESIERWDIEAKPPEGSKAGKANPKLWKLSQRWRV